MKQKNLLLTAIISTCALFTPLAQAAYSEVNNECISPVLLDIRLIGKSSQEAQCSTGYLWVKPNAKFYVKAHAQLGLNGEKKNWVSGPGIFHLMRRATSLDVEIFQRSFNGLYDYGTWTNGSKDERFMLKLRSDGNTKHGLQYKKIYGKVYTNG